MGAQTTQWCESQPACGYSVCRQCTKGPQNSQNSAVQRNGLYIGSSDASIWSWGIGWTERQLAVFWRESGRGGLVMWRRKKMDWVRKLWVQGQEGGQKRRGRSGYMKRLGLPSVYALNHHALNSGGTRAGRARATALASVCFALVLALALVLDCSLNFSNCKQTLISVIKLNYRLSYEM